MNDDGYYVFFPEDNGGHWSAELLLAVGQKLMDMNRKWDEQVKECLSE